MQEKARCKLGTKHPRLSKALKSYWKSLGFVDYLCIKIIFVDQVCATPPNPSLLQKGRFQISSMRLYLIPHRTHSTSAVAILKSERKNKVKVRRVVQLIHLFSHSSLLDSSVA